MRGVLILLFLLSSGAALADILVPARTIRAREIIGSSDLVRKAADVPGAATHVSELVGQEARIALYAGRPIRLGDVGPPAIVDRNDIVALRFKRSGLNITTEGRVLGRGAVGDTIRVMNLSSRTTVTGWILEDGSVEVR